MNLFIWYPKCSTCQKARQALEEKGLSLELRDIKQDNPTKEELKTQEIQEKINEYKKQKYKLGIFVAGQENYPEVLNKIVTKQVELSDNVC